MTILFVCSGNIHRSALAAGLLSHLARRDGRSDLVVLSAGVIAVAGLPCVEEARSLARADGVDLSDHRSRPLDEVEAGRADLIVLMETHHRERIAGWMPWAIPRCRLLSEYAGTGCAVRPGDDVPDAIGETMDSFRRVYAIIRDCVMNLHARLPESPQEAYAAAVEERFRRRRGRAVTLSSADWQILEAWWRSGVPLWIVTESLDTLLARGSPTGQSPRVRSLAYIRSEVEERFEAYRRARAGEPYAAGLRDAAGEEPAGQLQDALRELSAAAERAARSGRAGVVEILRASIAHLTPLSAEGDEAAVRLALHDEDEAMGRTLRETAEPGLVESLRNEAIASLGSHRERMTEDAFEATVSRLLDEKIRRWLGVPRLA